MHYVHYELLEKLKINRKNVYFSDETTEPEGDDEKEEPEFDILSMPMYLQLYDALLEVQYKLLFRVVS